MYENHETLCHIVHDPSTATKKTIPGELNLIKYSMIYGDWHACFDFNKFCNLWIYISIPTRINVKQNKVAIIQSFSPILYLV